MAAPSSTVWGSIVNGSSDGRKGRLGIYTNVSNTATQTTVNVQVWFWTIYSCTDSNNVFYYDAGTNVSSASTSQGSKSISHSVNSGAGWSTSNQTKLIDKTYTYTRGTSAAAYKVYAKLANIDMLNGAVSFNTSYTVPALDSYTISYNANGGSGAPGNQTKYYGVTLTISSTKPTRTGYSFQGWSLTKGGSVYYTAGSACGKNENLTLYAVWKANTYTVSYNANGGSNAPGNQTKTYGVTLTLSSTKPTRTGYSFQGWSLTKDGSVYYNPGASCGKNENLTLYAVWKANTYTVSYNANGGSGAPGNQTKTYNVTLKLSSIVPKRENYTFLGWATSASSTTYAYSAGSNYTGNAALNLYAVWELAYTKPIIEDFSVGRCNADGNISDSGTYGLVQFSATCDRPMTSVFVEWLSETQGSGSMELLDTLKSDGLIVNSFTAEHVSWVVGNGTLSTEATYTIKLTVTDELGYYTVVGTLNGSKFAMDFRPMGNGVAFGKPAELDNVCDIAYQTRFLGGILHPVLEPDTDLNDVRTPNTYIGANIYYYNYSNCPTNTGTFTLEVVGMGEDGQVKQTFTSCIKTSSRTWERIYHSTNGIMSWGEWFCVSDFAGQLLWQGGYYMNVNQTANLSEPVSKQRSGIVLVFSNYDVENYATVDSDFSCHFIPKLLVSTQLGKLHTFVMASANFGYVATKTVAVFDDRIDGTEFNDDVTTTSGISNKNNRFVLRYVIGV